MRQRELVEMQRDNDSNRAGVSCEPINRKEEENNSTHFGSTDEPAPVRPNKHASYPLQLLVQFGQMEGGWCDSGSRDHYDYDGLMSCNDRPQP
jgi:hypothetical protein